jgi:lipopolysaccharide transport system permease protein
LTREVLAHYRDLVFVLVAKELKVRYRSTVLGYAWSLLHPLAFAAIFFVLFKVVMRIPREDYALFLITGLFPWQWFANSIGASTVSFLHNSSLIRKVMFPRHLLVLAAVLNDMFHFLVSVPVIVLFMLYHRTVPSLSWIVLLPLLVLIQLMFTHGVALALATCNLFFRDLERLAVILTTLWFYVTPVLFPADMIPAGLGWVVYANPLAAIVGCWRGLFLDGSVPGALLGLAAAWAILALGAGHRVYRALSWRFAEIV